MDRIGTDATRWLVVVPVKLLATAKSRLDPGAGPVRRELALAMALDTVDAALAAGQVDVVVVTGDDVVASAARAAGAEVLTDRPDDGLNGALRLGAHAGRGHRGVAALTADLPALRPTELRCALRELERLGHAFVADAAGTGTTCYGTTDVAAFDPRFGVGSAARHAAVATAVALALPTLRRDVDTVDDLWRAVQLGVGPRTAALLPALPGGSASPRSA